MPARIHTDWPMFIAILVILAFGLVMVFSASSTSPRMLKQGQTWQPEKAWTFLKQFAAAVVGLLLLFALRRMDYQKLQHPLYVFLPINLLFILLIGVIFADPKAHRWYRLGSLQFQPSELAKPALVVFLAWFVARRENKIDADRYTLLALLRWWWAGWRGDRLWRPGHGDGAAHARGGGLLRGRHRAPVLLPHARAGGGSHCRVHLAEAGAHHPRHQFLRAHGTEDPERRAPALAGQATGGDQRYPRRRTSAAAGKAGDRQRRGGGRGTRAVTQKLGYLPEAHTDFIFGVIGEETGLVASMLLLEPIFSFSGAGCGCTG